MGGGASKQAAFASRLGRELGVAVSVSTLSNWETGRRTVPGAAVVQAAILANTSMDRLLGDLQGLTAPIVLEEPTGAANLEGRVERSEQRLEALATLVGQLQEASDAQRQLLKNLIREIRTSGVAGELENSDITR